MMIGEILLSAALLVAGATVITGVGGLWPPKGCRRSGASFEPIRTQAVYRNRILPQRLVAAQETWWVASRLLIWILGILLGGAVLYLALLLLVGDFSVLYVWKHSATYQAPGKRLAALLAGQEGTLLLWSFLTSLIGLWTMERYVRMGTPEREGSKIVHTTVVALVFGLLLITVQSAPFQSFASAFPEVGLSTPVEGNGLNPVLLNPWMPLHTFFTFAGYALVSLLFSLGLLQLLRGAQGRFSESSLWHGERRATARSAWLLLTLALLTGVIWAYEEMTFGWYWSWDPVEASTLVIWLVLTTALHGASSAPDSAAILPLDVTGRRIFLLAPFLAALTLVTVIFTAFVTRSGLHPSVHAFAGGGAGLYLGVFLVVLTLAVSILSILAWRRAGAYSRDHPVIDWTTGLLMAGALLVAWGVSYPIMASQWQQRPVDLDTGFFNLWGYLLALVMLFVIGLELPPKAGGSRRLSLAILVLVLTVVAAFVKPVHNLDLISADRRLGAGLFFEILGRASILSFFPPAGYALLAVWERWRSTTTGSPRPRIRESGIAAIHAGIIVALAGIVMSSLFTSTITVAVNPLISPIGSKDGITVRMLDYTYSEQMDARGAVVAQQETVKLEIYAGDTPVAVGQTHLTTYPERNMGRHARVMTHRGLLVDTQVIYHGLSEMGSDGVPVTVRRIPLVSLLWAGLLLFVLGFSLVQGSRLLPDQAWQRQSGRHHPEREATGTVAGKRSVVL